MITHEINKPFSPVSTSNETKSDAYVNVTLHDLLSTIFFLFKRGLKMLISNWNLNNKKKTGKCLNFIFFKSVFYFELTTVKEFLGAIF